MTRHLGTTIRVIALLVVFVATTRVGSLKAQPDPPNYLLLMGHPSVLPGGLASPEDVAVDGNGNIYVADALNDRIQVFNPDGSFQRAFGS
ncbi:MAG: hypothetical protein ACE5G0_04300, partial [Rhodothermales bacterium]